MANYDNTFGWYRIVHEENILTGTTFSVDKLEASKKFSIYVMDNSAEGDSTYKIFAYIAPETLDGVTLDRDKIILVDETCGGDHPLNYDASFFEVGVEVITGDVNFSLSEFVEQT